MKKTKNQQKLTKIQAKRVAILKDAIAQIKLGAYDPQSCIGFVDGREDLDLGEIFAHMVNVAELLTGKKPENLELRSFIDRVINKQKPCQVCAKGALLLSSIRKFNNFSLEKAEKCSLDSSASDETRKTFGKENADLMENYFEYGAPNTDFEEIDEWKELTDSERAIRIFQNAIRNKGIFKPNLEKF